MRNKFKLVIIIILIFASGCFYWQVKHRIDPSLASRANDNEHLVYPQSRQPIDQLTRADLVADYLHTHHVLPDFYLKKSQAKQWGWRPNKGNLCDVLPGKAIGGDHFANREGHLPKKTGRKWFEADVNYHCSRRSTSRLLYSSDGLIFITYDHYRSFGRLF